MAVLITEILKFDVEQMQTGVNGGANGSSAGGAKKDN